MAVLIGIFFASRMHRMCSQGLYSNASLLPYPPETPLNASLVLSEMAHKIQIGHTYT